MNIALKKNKGFRCRRRRLLTLNEGLSRPVCVCVCVLVSHRRCCLCFTRKRCFRSHAITNAPYCKSPWVTNMCYRPSNIFK